jgi:hypothetical protein
VNDTKIAAAENHSSRKPSYFNSGCCCYNDGDITGIEIAGEKISLIKWHWENNSSQRSVLEEKELSELNKKL